MESWNMSVSKRGMLHLPRIDPLVSLSCTSNLTQKRWTSHFYVFAAIRSRSTHLGLQKNPLLLPMYKPNNTFAI